MMRRTSIIAVALLATATLSHATTMEEAHRNPACRQYDTLAPRGHDMVEAVKAEDAEGRRDCALIGRAVRAEARLGPLARQCATPKLTASLGAIDAEYQRNVQFYQQSCGR